MIKPTHEMVTAFMRAAQATPVQLAGRELMNVRAGLAAAFSSGTAAQKRALARELLREADHQDGIDGTEIW